MGDQRRLLGGLGDHRIAGGEGCGDLAGEDGQGEVPRRNTGEHAAAVQFQRVELGHRPVQHLRRAEQPLGRGGVVAQEVDGLAHLAHRVGPALAGLAHGQRRQPVEAGLQRVGHGAQDAGAAGAALRVPRRLRLVRRPDRQVEHVGYGIGRGRADLADHARPVGGGAHRLAHQPRRLAPSADQHARLKPLAVEPGQGRQHAVALGAHAKVAARRVGAGAAVERGRRRNLRVAVGARLQRGHRVADHLFGRHGVVQQGVDEARVGAVLQKAPHEVGQELLVPAHRRVGAQPQVAVARLRPGVERLAHAVQALELHRHAGPGRHALHRGQRLGVVGGELAVEVRRGRDDRRRGGHVVDVGGGLGGPDRVVRPTGDLRLLQLGVPVGALDQTHHQPSAGAAGEFGHALHRLDAALLVGLHRQAQATPVAQLRLARQPVQELEREHQPVGLLRVDGEVEVVARGDHRQPLEPRVELAPHPSLLQGVVAGRQGGELHRHAVSVLGAPAVLRAADGLDGGGVARLVAGGVGGGARPLAQHVEAADIALAPGAAERLLDGAPQHELLAHDADGAAHRGPDDRLAEPGGEAAEVAGHVCARLGVHVDELAGEHQAEGGGVDEHAVGAAHVAGPVGRADLLSDQGVARGVVGGAQEGLGQAHQRQPLGGAQAELLQEALDNALPARRAAGGAHEVGRLGGDLRPVGGGQGLEL